MDERDAGKDRVNKGTGYDGPDPTLSGYLEFAKGIDHDATSEQLRLEYEDRWSEPKPAIVFYQGLEDLENRLLDYARGLNGRLADELKEHLSEQAQRTKTAEEQDALKKYAGDRVEEWKREKTKLDEKQKTSFEKDVGTAVKKWERGNMRSRDTSEFLARREVVAQYCQQHEVLNQNMISDITVYVDKMPGQERDTAEKGWERFQERQGERDHALQRDDRDRERER